MDGEIKEYEIKLGAIKNSNITVHKLKTIEGRHKSNGNIVWTVEFEFFDGLITTNQNFALSRSINEVRKIIEQKGYRMLIKWSEIEAVQSGILADMSAGTMMYRLNEVEECNRMEGNSPMYRAYHVLEETDFENAVTIDVQEKFFFERFRR